MKNAVTLVWFRQDLRLADHPALHEACKAGAVIPVHILDPTIPCATVPGSRAFV